MVIKTTFIYVLKEPLTGEIRYVGKANNPKRRFCRHIRETSLQETHIGRWIRRLVISGRKPGLEILDEVPVSQWEFWEREYIRVFRSLGMKLTNISDGGNQGPCFRGEDHPNFGTKQNPEDVERRIKKIRGRKQTEEARRNTSLSRIGMVFTAEHRANIGRVQIGRKASEETRAKMRSSQSLRREREKISV